jgi:prepilin-type N-terminal cleavage/methylation domain-containing protein
MSLDHSHEAAVIRLRSRSRLASYGATSSRGFTVIELLLAMAITVAIAAAIASQAPQARAAFERVPSELDLQQRGRTAIDVLSQAVRAAGSNVVATSLLGSLSELFPVVSVSNPDDSGTAFTSMTVILPVKDAAQGVLSADQASPGGSLTLATTPCPNVKDVCGFMAGTVAVVTDGQGHFDVFVVASTNPGARRMTPDRMVSQAYPAGSVVVEVEESTFSLVEQADGNYSLVRETAAGAVQPVVDSLADLTFSASGVDVPAGFTMLQQVDIALTVRAPTELLQRVLADRVFRTSIRLRNAS